MIQPFNLHQPLGYFPAELSSQNGNTNIDLCVFLKTFCRVYELNNESRQLEVYVDKKQFILLPTGLIQAMKNDRFVQTTGLGDTVPL